MDKAIISIVLSLSSQESKNEKAIDMLAKQDLSFGPCELLVNVPEDEDGIFSCTEALTELYHVVRTGWDPDKAVRYNRSIDAGIGDYVIFVTAGDVFAEDYLLAMYECMMNPDREKVSLAMPQRWYQHPTPTGGVKKEKEVLSYRIFSEIGAHLVSWERDYNCVPYFIDGCLIDAAYLRAHPFREKLYWETEREFLFHLMAAEGKILYVNLKRYFFINAIPSDPVYFPGCYEKEWYYESIDDFWVPFLEEMKERFGSVPRVFQYQLIFALMNKVNTNLNNTNKHCVPEGEGKEYLASWNRVLKYVDDEVILNRKNYRFALDNAYLKQLFMKIKLLDENYRFSSIRFKGKTYFGTEEAIVTSQDNQTANIQFMDYEDGMLYIDGTLASMYNPEEARFFLKCGDQELPVTYNSRYSHTKLFGESIYKRNSFRVEYPVADVNRQALSFRVQIGDEQISVPITYDSHFSRLSKHYKNGYWTFGDPGKLFMATAKGNSIVIYKIRKLSILKRELKLWREMFKSKRPAARKFLALRMGYWIMKPIWKKRPVWMFIDKIYKAGDSSEYLYRYADAQKDNIDCYYLVDKNSADYARLKKDGYKPLVRGTIKHRLMFLYADMMVISNSTVFAFNDYTLAKSGFIRDLANFHVCCVQHGMSVQKIAIAQNRLRDNIRLYFCASPYEIENLTRPVYDYVGHDALKLTGVPRYDGLVDEDKKQLLIAPTWRMQAAVPVTKSEGFQRDYNPLFKESDYYRVYNSLINDERLLAAAKEYGYRIHYVLHPIVSSQSEDFDKNDYVDIIPSVGDMSYEKEFRESSLMVSDYSGVQFDFAYMRKPVVYLHHDDIPQHYEEGTFHYDTMGFGEICHNNEQLIDVLIEYMKNGCKMKPEYRRRADDFFEYDDHNNCKRIYDVMINYQKKKILK